MGPPPFPGDDGAGQDPVATRRPGAAAAVAALAAGATLAGALPGCWNAGPGGAGPAAAFEVHEASIAELQAAMAAGRVTAAGLVDAYLARIDAYDRAGPTLNAVLYLNAEARAQAAALDRERARSGPRGPLHGIPVLLKDNFNTADMPTTGASIALEGMVPPEDATIVRRLRDAGAVILGKTNLHEFAYGYTTVSSLGGQTVNPYHPGHYAGGSSGGTVAAVAAGFAAIGYGTDTCGSIRIPAAFNALFGLRPTSGLISNHGVMPLARTQDVAGPLARTVADLAAGLDAIAGADPADPATAVLAGRPVPRFADALRADALQDARIGLLTNYFGDAPEDREVGDIVAAAVRRMAEHGAEIVELALPGLDTLLAGTSVITMEFRFQIADYLAAIPDSPVDSLAEILERGLHHEAIAAALRASNAVAERESGAYRRALARQAAARETMIRFLDEHRLDAVAYPPIRRPPAAVGEPQRGPACQLAAATGLPALAAPAGYTEAGLPVGLELLGRPFDDARLVALAFAYEQATSPRRPPAHTPPLAPLAAPAPNGPRP